MKLLYCPTCADVFKLAYTERRCACGLVRGRYLDRTNAEVNGEGVSLAIDNRSVFPLRQPLARRVSIEAWARPHEGPLNPHTRVVKEADDGR